MFDLGFRLEWNMLGVSKVSIRGFSSHFHILIVSLESRWHELLDLKCKFSIYVLCGVVGFNDV